MSIHYTHTLTHICTLYAYQQLLVIYTDTFITKLYITHSPWTTAYTHTYQHVRLSVAKLSMATGHAMQINNCLGQLRQL